jgi:hypothetical protein
MFRKNGSRQPGVSHVSRLALLVLIAIAAFGGLAAYRWTERHPEHVPWAPLALAHPVGRFTPLKLERLRTDFAACRALLDEANIAYRALPPVHANETCGYADGVRFTADDGIGYSPAVAASCVVAAGLRLWEREVVEPAAMRHFGRGVTGITTFGTYACRRIGGGSRGRFSEHARANAIDIAAFTLAGGEQVSIAADWNGDAAKVAFLTEVRDGACRIFGTTLSPDYNAAHHDHLHLDQAPRGGITVCS